MDNAKYICSILIGMVSSFAVLAVVWLIQEENVQLAGFICIVFSICFVGLFFIERKKRRYLANELAALKSDLDKITVPFSQHVKDSEFEFIKFAGSVEKTLFVVGPNLNFLVATPGIKEFIFYLMLKHRIEIDFLLTSTESDAISVMNDVAFTKTFEDELKNSIEKFREWKGEAIERKLKFNFKVANAIILSMLFVDAEDANGKLLLIPIPWQVNGSDRPCFMLKKDVHPEAFRNYYNSYKALYDNVAKEI